MTPDDNKADPKPATIDLDLPDMELLDSGASRDDLAEAETMALEEELDAEEAEAPGEDDDNAYQESDEALPDDAEEAAISRDPSREGKFFGDV